MKSLLKRQIRKYLPPELEENESLIPFLEIVAKSYENFEDQSAMIQRAMSISSEELSEANSKLKQESFVLKKVINRLKEVTVTLNPEEDRITSSTNLELDTDKLVSFIDNQTKEIVKMNNQRDELLRNLALKNAELSEYAHIVSHDLKSPLRSINALTSWFKEDYESKIDEEGNKTLNLIGKNVEKMEALINGILHYSTIDEVKTESYDVDLNKLLNDLLHTLYKPDNFSIYIKNELPTIKGDNYRLQQLFQNLIDNAIKHNSKPIGEIEIGSESKDGFWQFYVKDNGNGIDEAYHEKIFHVFTKLDNVNDSTGIGLSIVKKIVSFFGGKTWIESTLNVGTTFYFTIKK